MSSHFLTVSRGDAQQAGGSLVAQALIKKGRGPSSGRLVVSRISIHKEASHFSCPRNGRQFTLDGPFVFEARVYVAVRKLGRLEVVGGERVDELVEFLLLRLIVRVGLV